MAGRFYWKILTIIIAIFVTSVAFPADSFAFKHHRHKKHVALSISPQFSALVVDGKTGAVLYQQNANAIRYPASLTKMMTLYLAFEALDKGRLHMNESLPVSAYAAAQPQTNISLSEGDRLPVRTAIESIVVRSANDSAMVLAEYLGGSAQHFAQMMTAKAHELGMSNTVFYNPNGLPDPRQHTTAMDMAKLGIALRRDFPDYYPFFKLESFSYAGVTYPGHNHVMERYDGVDGIKTGYIRASGYNLVTSAHKNGYSIVAVIMGGKTIQSRDDQMISLLDRTFDQLAGNHSDNGIVRKTSSLTANNDNNEDWPTAPQSAKSF